MRVAFPHFEKCCCIVPLRNGILTFGYLNLVSTILLLVLNGFVGISPVLTITVSNYRGLSEYLRWLPRFLYVMEVIFNVILLVGAHTKRPLLMRIYYFYGILTTVTTFLAFVELQVHHYEQYWYWTVLEYCFSFTGFALQIYLLLLIKAELKKLKEQTEQQKGQDIAEVVVDDPRMQTEGRNWNAS